MYCWYVFMASLLPALAAANGVMDETRRWADGIVPFAFSRMFTSNWRYESLVEEAMKEIEKSTCVRFVKHNTEPDYIIFVASLR